MVKLTPDANNNLQKISAVDCFQVRSVSEIRIIKKVGLVNIDQLDKICTALAIVFGIN